MARIKGPLMSITASGSLAGTLVFRQTARGAQAQAMPTSQPPATPAQAACRADFKAAADAWRTLDAETRADWQTVAAVRHRSARQFFLAEWRVQHSTPENLPRIPADHY